MSGCTGPSGSRGAGPGTPGGPPLITRPSGPARYLLGLSEPYLVFIILILFVYRAQSILEIALRAINHVRDSSRPLCPAPRPPPARARHVN